jgi:hypothetical protein
MKTKPAPVQYRQGDVLLERVDSLPKKGLKEVPREDGKIIVAIGSSNGNPHYFTEPKSKLLTDVDGDRFLRLAGQPIKGSFPILDENCLRVLVLHPKLGKVAFSHADAVKSKKGPAVAKVSGRFSLLNHAEHDVHAVRAGNYSHVPQRGFNRGEIRRVQD